MDNVVIVVGAFAALIGLFIVLAGALRLLEWMFPAFATWLDTLDSERRGF